MGNIAVIYEYVSDREVVAAFVYNTLWAYIRRDQLQEQTRHLGKFYIIFRGETYSECLEEIAAYHIRTAAFNLIIACVNSSRTPKQHLIGIRGRN